LIKLDPTRRADAIEAGWRAYAEHVPTHRDAYLRACAAWQVVAVVDDGKPVGALFAKDGVIHLGIVPEWRGRWASRRVIRDMLAYGKRTEMAPGESLEFVSRIGNIDRRFSWQG
jgi:GNAT superfamily N-acetyltransferase